MEYDEDSAENIKNMINECKMLIWINNGACWREDTIKALLQEQYVAS
jgi:hypothetical protein